MNMYMYLYVWMYFWIDYKFIFLYEASLSSREVGGGSNPLWGPSISASKLREGGDIYSPRGQSKDGHVSSQQVRSGSQQSQGGQDVSQPHRGGHQFEKKKFNVYKFVYMCFF